MKFHYNTILILLFSFLISDVNGPTMPTDIKKETTKYPKVPPVGNKELTFLNGDPIKFNDLYSDVPVLFSFWFLSCAPCREEMKHLSKFNEQYKDSGFKVISINTDIKSKGKVRSAAKKYSFDILFDVNGKDGLLKKFGSNACPFTVLVNMDGTIYSKHLGYEVGDEIALEKEILEFIEYNKQFSSLIIDGSSDSTTSK